jgi:hypothetical protein
MHETIGNFGNYRIEVSGWGLNSAFFVEKTDLIWTSGDEKRLRLHHALADGAVVFVRLISPESSFGSAPVAYQVQSVQPMNSEGLCEMQLLRLHPRSKPHTRIEVASPTLKYSSKGHEAKEIAIQTEFEEVLHEA